MTVVRGDPRQLTERQFQAQVIELFTLTGWDHYHVFDSRRSNPGFPDLVLWHPKHGIIFAELKTDRGRTTPAQDACLGGLNRAAKAKGAHTNIAVVWRPRDFEKIADVAQHGLRKRDSLGERQ